MPGLLLGAAPAVDLSLPPDPQVLATAAPNPQEEAARLTESGRPEQIRAVGQGFVDAGAGMDEVLARSVLTRQVVGASFTNDGRPVYDPATHDARLPGGFRDAGTDLHAVGRRLDAVADELGAAITDVSGALDRLHADLGARRSAWVAQVQAARGPDGLVPAAQVPALLARRRAVVAGMEEAAGACARTVAARVGRYDEVLNDCLRLTGGVGSAAGLVGVDPTTGVGSPFDAVVARLEGSTAAPVVGGPGVVPAPRGPLQDVAAPAPQLPGTPGFVPAPAGPEALVTLPAPDLGATRTDQGQDVGPPGVQIDAAGRHRAPDLLTPQQQLDLRHYLDNGFRTINAAERGQIPSTPETRARADAVSAALAQLPPVRATVYRGTRLTDEQLAAYRPGTTITEDGFTSTSIDPEATFPGNVDITVDSVNGRYTAPYSPYPMEQEVTFDRGTRFHVLAHTVDAQTGRHKIILGEVPQ